MASELEPEPLVRPAQDREGANYLIGEMQRRNRSRDGAARLARFAQGRHAKART